jgi:hypothetical protein
MVDFKLLNSKPRLQQEKIREILQYLQSVKNFPRTPIEDEEVITICKEFIRCKVFNDKAFDVNETIINLVKAGYTVLTCWDEYNPDLPTTIFCWHPSQQNDKLH